MCAGEGCYLAGRTACRWIRVLLQALDQNQVRPGWARGRSREEEEFPEGGILTDKARRPVRRLQEARRQKEEYEGKKKRQTRTEVAFTHP